MGYTSQAYPASHRRPDLPFVSAPSEPAARAVLREAAATRAPVPEQTTEKLDVRMFQPPRPPDVPTTQASPVPVQPGAGDTQRLDVSMFCSPPATPPAEATGRGYVTVPGTGSSLPLTLEQHAALRAELSISPERAASILQRYGLAEPGAREAVDESFVRAFRADPDMLRHWQALLAHFQGWYGEHASSAQAAAADVEDGPSARRVPAGTEAPPGKQLARFDPETGEALPEPTWVDVP